MHGTAFHALAAAGLLAACAGATTAGREEGSPPLRGIDFVADVAVLESFPVRLAGTVRITNRRATPVRLMFPDTCVAMLRVYDGDDSRSAPVWDQRHTTSCDGDAATLEIEPGGTTEVRVPTVSAAAILGDSLPDGTYRFTAYLRPEGGRVVEVEAGIAELAAPRSDRRDQDRTA